MMTLYLFCIVLLLCSCTLKERVNPNETKYMTTETTTFAPDDPDAPVIDPETGAEDLTSIMKFVKGIDYGKMSIPTKESFENEKVKDEAEDKLWKELVAYTVYKRMPVGWEADFKLKKFLSVEYTYKMYINGMPGIDFDKECEMVKEFLVKRVFETTGYFKGE